MLRIIIQKQKVKDRINNKRTRFTNLVVERIKFINRDFITIVEVKEIIVKRLSLIKE